MGRTRVYVSGPYSSDPELGTANAIAAGQTLLMAGYAPMVPHLTHYWHTLHFDNDYEYWLALDLAWVDVADVVLRLPGRSSGADREVAAAEAAGVPVVYSVRDLLLQVPAEDTPAVQLPAGISQALDRIAAIFAKKGADYADDSNWRSNFADVARQLDLTEVDAVDVMIAVKQSRLRALRSNGRTPMNESTADTYLDRAVYAVIALAMLLEDGAAV